MKEPGGDILVNHEWNNNHRITHSQQYSNDLCLVWASQTATDGHI